MKTWQRVSHREALVNRKKKYKKEHRNRTTAEARDPQSTEIRVTGPALFHPIIRRRLLQRR